MGFDVLPLANVGFGREPLFVVAFALLTGCLLGRVVVARILRLLYRQSSIAALRLFGVCVFASTLAMAVTVVVPACLWEDDFEGRFIAAFVCCFCVIAGLLFILFLAGVISAMRAGQGKRPSTPMPRFSYGLVDLLIMVGVLALWLLVWECSKSVLPLEDIPLVIPWLTMLRWANEYTPLTPPVVIVSCVGSVLVAFLCFVDVARFTEEGRQPATRRTLLFVFLLASWFVAPLLVLGWACWRGVKSLLVAREAKSADAIPDPCPSDPSVASRLNSGSTDGDSR